jgi:DNA-binding CsgD family transcriptional regulator/tetratricopeptide (TPR) repeat protein
MRWAECVHSANRMFQPASRQLFGREGELAVLIRALADSERGRARVVWIGGEPGIGKTRLAEELGATAATRRATVAWARCVDAGAAPPYWPWAEGIRALLQTVSWEELYLPVSCLERISALVPDLMPRGSTPIRSAPLTTASDRYQLFDAVRTLLQRASSRAVVVLVLDDLHQGDPSSLLLLEFVARELSDSRLLIVATYRADEVSRPLLETMGELARLGLQKVALTGLGVEETGQLLRHASGNSCSDDLVRQVHARTNGNPFFVTEVAHLQSSDRDVIPDNVRAVLQRRLSRLSEATIQLLTVGSVMGREFDFRIAAAIVHPGRDLDLLSSLDEALERLIIEPMPAAGESWYRFRHALVRDAVYERVSPSRRAYWHAAVVELMEQRLSARVEEHAADLAYHAARAEALVGTSRVVKYSRLAGERMLATHAFDEALRHFERAWRGRNSVPCDDDAAGILAGLGLAQAATSVRWNRQEAWAKVRRAIEYYLEAGDIQKAVAAATHASLAAEGVSGVTDVVRRLLPLVREGSREAAALLARGAAAAYFETGNDQPTQQWFARALAIASSHEDTGLELRVLGQFISVDHFALRWHDALVKSRRVLELAGRGDELHWHAYASYRAAYALVNTGRTEEASEQVQETLTVAERLRDRGLLGDALYMKALLGELRGQWDEARAQSDRGLALAAAHLPLLHIRAVLEYETGNDVAGGQYVQRLIEADRDAQPYPLAGIFTALALSHIAYISNGMTDTEPAITAARAIMAKRSAVRNAVVQARLGHALVSVLDADIDECEADLEALAPFEFVMPTQSGLVTGRVLGLLAHAVGQKRRAWNHFEQALVFCRASGFKPELAWTCHDYATALLDLGDRDDRVKATVLLDEGEQIAAALGLEPLRKRIAAFRERYRLRLARNPAGLTTREFEVLQLLASGKANKDIAEALFISTHTVAVHVARVLEKTGSANRTAAVAYATRHHLLESTRSGTADERPPRR